MQYIGRQMALCEWETLFSISLAPPGAHGFYFLIESKVITQLIIEQRLPSSFCQKMQTLFKLSLFTIWQSQQTISHKIKMGKKDFVKEGPKKGFCQTKERQPLVSSPNLLAEIEGLLDNFRQFVANAQKMRVNGEEGGAFLEGIVFTNNQVQYKDEKRN